MEYQKEREKKKKEKRKRVWYTGVAPHALEDRREARNEGAHVLRGQVVHVHLHRIRTLLSTKHAPLPTQVAPHRHSHVTLHAAKGSSGVQWGQKG
eukprot:1796611-Rhodomonas_salina.1